MGFAFLYLGSIGDLFVQEMPEIRLIGFTKPYAVKIRTGDWAMKTFAAFNPGSFLWISLLSTSTPSMSNITACMFLIPNCFRVLVFKSFFEFPKANIIFDKDTKFSC